MVLNLKTIKLITMLTKTECLSDKWNPQSSAIDTSDVHLMDAVNYGMQLYAKEVAIEFDVYITKNKLFQSDISGKPLWYQSNNHKFKPISSKKLFELFLQSINQK
jgi:hypothetical protein